MKERPSLIVVNCEIVRRTTLVSLMRAFFFLIFFISTISNFKKKYTETYLFLRLRPPTQASEIISFDCIQLYDIIVYTNNKTCKCTRNYHFHGSESSYL